MSSASNSGTGSGRVVLVGTPLGNIHDASDRLRSILTTADVLAAEDSRRCHALCEALGVKPRGTVVSHFDHNEQSRRDELLEHVARGRTVAVLTDAGMPSISDPGFALTSAAAEQGMTVTAVPGPSAVTTAVALSGLPCDRFCFEGFMPRRASERRQRLRELAGEPRTMVFFESPHRIAATLSDAATELGAQRPAAVCRELTKMYEEIRRGSLQELSSWAEGGVKGEITVVIAGAESATYSLDDAVELVERSVASGTRLKDACKDVSSLTGWKSADLYQAALQRKAQ